MKKNFAFNKDDNKKVSTANLKTLLELPIYFYVRCVIYKYYEKDECLGLKVGAMHYNLLLELPVNGRAIK